MTGKPYIDTHVHFWDLQQQINSWVAQSKDQELHQNFLPESFIIKSPQNLKGLVHIEAHDSTIPTEIEQAWLQEIMSPFPDLDFKSIAYADLTQDPRTFEKIIYGLQKYPSFIGIRHILSYRPNSTYSPCQKELSQHPNIIKNLHLLKQQDLIFECQCYAEQLLNLLPAIQSSQVTCVIEHVLLPNHRNDADKILWLKALEKAGKLKNTYIKLSGLDLFNKKLNTEKIIKTCLLFFGASHCLYGSNHPVSHLNQPGNWFQKLNQLDLSLIEKQQIFYSTAKQVYQI